MSRAKLNPVETIRFSGRVSRLRRLSDGQFAVYAVGLEDSPEGLGIQRPRVLQAQHLALRDCGVPTP